MPSMKKLAKTSAKEFLSWLRDDIWPIERDVVERPQRMKYVRKLIRPKGCVFCACAKAKDLKEALVLYRSRKMMIVLNKYPYNNGHLLIMPRRHIGELDKLSDLELQGSQVLLKHAIRILKKVYQPQGFNVGLNLGSVAGAGIPDHLHYHVIPRWSGDTNFFPLIAQTKLVIETTEQSYDKLRPEFAKLEKKIVV